MNDESTGHEPDEEFGVEEPRSIFSALWFRIVIGVAALGVIAGVAVPYVLEWTRPPLPDRSSTARASRPAAPPATQESASGAAPAETAKPVAAASSVPAAAPTAAPVTPSAGPSDVKPAASAPSAKPSSSTGAGEAKPAVESTAAGRGEATAAASRPETKPPAEPDAARIAAARAPARMTGDAAGAYWVQVGAYKDAGTAERLAAKLREYGYHVSEVGPAAAPAETPAAAAPAPEPAATPRADTYDVIVSGGPAATVTQRLVARGLVADATSAGVVVRPALPLAEAIALSKELAVDGLKVQVRRAGLAPAARSAAEGAGTSTSDTLHRVRVGAYPDRATALAAVKELSARGYEGFVARAAH